MASGNSIYRGLAMVAGVVLAAAPALAAAHEDGSRGEWRNGSWYGDTPPGPPRPMYPGDEPRSSAPRYDPAARDAWLADCRSRVSSRDDGVGGAVIGGVVGGVAGNRIAGRHHRTVGTLAGAAVGAAAGVAIDRAEDRGSARDECEAYLDDYYTQYSRSYAPGYGYPGYAPAYPAPYGYGGGCCMSAPVMMVPVVQSAPQCTETVEYVYEDVPVRRKTYHPARVKRTKIVPDKRVKIIQDKRITVK